ncbi:hypothetical protein D3C87_1597910 [compost metagenome]
MMAMKALRVTTFSRLSIPMKFGLATAPRTSSKASATKGATARRSQSFEVFGVLPLSSAASVIFPLNCLFFRPICRDISPQANSCVCTPVASATISFSVMRSPVTSPTILPERITRTRSQMPISSGISEDTTMIDLPSSASFAMKR